ncbi:unnamed protein product [Schistosoma guineensis]|nr:unnamed protein product [Schistosoma guineensis]
MYIITALVTQNTHFTILLLRIENAAVLYCLDASMPKKRNRKFVIVKEWLCYKKGGNQDGTIHHRGECLEIDDENSKVQLSECTRSLEQQWTFNSKLYFLSVDKNVQL